MTARQTIVCFGDSQTDLAAGYTTAGFDMWPAVLRRSLRAGGLDAIVRAFGVSGDTTLQVLARIADGFFYDQPTVAVLYDGVNDPGTYTTAQTQANKQAQIKALKHRAIGDGLGSGPTVAGQASLPQTGKLNDRYVVLSDTSTTGGAAAFDPLHHATITGSIAADANGQKQTVWEHRYNAAGELGWGRVATNATAPLKDPDGNLLGVASIVVVSTNYRNWTTGGDTPSTPATAYAAVRGALQAAVTAENGNGATVSYADLYTAQRALVVAGTVPDASVSGWTFATSWHWKQDDQHHNAYGNGLVAQVVRPYVAAALA